MKHGNVIQEKSYSFAIRIIKIYKQLIKDKKEFVLSKQLLRSGTSIGANAEEAIGAQTRKDFYSKMTISYKEARETHYWIRLLTDTDYLEPTNGKELLIKVEELLKIIGSIQKTIRNS